MDAKRGAIRKPDTLRNVPDQPPARNLGIVFGLRSAGTISGEAENARAPDLRVDPALLVGVVLLLVGLRARHFRPVRPSPDSAAYW